MRFTPRAREHLEDYVARLRRALEGREDVDAADVESGIREHVEAELSARSIDEATAEDVSDVLDGLGAPEAMAAEGDPATAGAEGEAREAREARGGRGGAAAALGLVVVGLALFVLNNPAWWVAVAAGVLLTRAFLPTSRPPRGSEERALLWVWQLAVAAGVVGILLAPAVLVWASAQIGGVLEGPLEAFTGLAGGERPARYWAAMAAAAGAVTGLWWLLMGMLLRSYDGGVSRAVGSACRMIPPRTAGALLALGGALFIVSILGGWLI